MVININRSTVHVETATGTATPADVRLGKKFIGLAGKVETGTLKNDPIANGEDYKYTINADTEEFKINFDGSLYGKWEIVPFGTLASRTPGTATGSDIVRGKSLVVNGTYINGTLVPITYGNYTNISMTETSDNNVNLKISYPFNDGLYDTSMYVSFNANYFERLLNQQNGSDASTKLASYIRLGKSLFGIEGTGSDVTANTSEYIASGKTIYANGEIITGTLSPATIDKNYLQIEWSNSNQDEFKISWMNPTYGPYSGIKFRIMVVNDDNGRIISDEIVYKGYGSSDYQDSLSYEYIAKSKMCDPWEEVDARSTLYIYTYCDGIDGDVLIDTISCMNGDLTTSKYFIG